MTIETTRIEWHGGENPVREGEMLVKVWFRDGREVFGDNFAIDDWDWSRTNHPLDIIAYAVTPERATETFPTRDCRAPAERPETLRDRVAMAALTGLIACPHTKERMSAEWYAREANRIADAFIAARGDA